jgi:hypothetical protein
LWIYKFQSQLRKLLVKAKARKRGRVKTAKLEYLIHPFDQGAKAESIFLVQF